MRGQRGGRTFAWWTVVFAADKYILPRQRRICRIWGQAYCNGSNVPSDGAWLERAAEADTFFC